MSLEEDTREKLVSIAFLNPSNFPTVMSLESKIDIEEFSADHSLFRKILKKTKKLAQMQFDYCNFINSLSEERLEAFNAARDEYYGHTGKQFKALMRKHGFEKEQYADIQKHLQYNAEVRDLEILLPQTDPICMIRMQSEILETKMGLIKQNKSNLSDSAYDHWIRNQSMEAEKGIKAVKLFKKKYYNKCSYLEKKALDESQNIYESIYRQLTN